METDMPHDRKDRLVWSSSNAFSVDGVNFFATVDPEIYHSRRSSEADFLIVKNREMIEFEIDAVRKVDARNVVDIGIWQGGSVAFLDAVLQPRKLVAIEYATRDLPTLSSYVTARGRQANIGIYNGVNQADAARVRSIAEAEFGGAPIDLVIDDASHFYDETRISFDVLFPRLGPGGVYIIEDWQWSTNSVHCESDYFKGKPSLANLLVQCMFLCAVRPDIISSMLVYRGVAIVTRGKATDLANFSIAEMATNRGLPVAPVL